MPRHRTNSVLRRDPNGLQVRQIRSLKKVKYIVNLKHNSHSYDPLLNSVLSQRRTFIGNIKVSYPEEKKRFLKKTKAAKSLELITAYDFVDRYPVKLRQAIKGFARLVTLQFNLLDPHAITSENLQKLLATYNRRNVYALHLSTLEFSKVNFYNFQFTKLQSLCLQSIAPQLLGIFLLKAPAFHGLKTLQLGTLNVIEDFPSEMVQNFALFPKLENLLMKVHLTDPELSCEFLSKFTVGAPLETLHITLKDLRFPNPLNCDPNDYLPFHKFAEKLSSARNLQDFKLHFSIIENFRGVNSLISHLPMNLHKVKKLSLEFLEQREANSKFEDTRIVMKNLFQWIFSMPSLQVFLLETLNRDYTGLSTLIIPENLNWKTFDILEWPEESQDTLKPNDFAVFMEILTKAQHLHCLNLSIEASQFNLDAYKVLIETIKLLKDLREINLKLNCRKFSLYDLELIEPALTHLKSLNSLSLLFIGDTVEEVEIWKYRLCKSFEKYQQLGMFNLSLYGPTKPIFIQSYGRPRSSSGDANSQALRRYPRYRI